MRKGTDPNGNFWAQPTHDSAKGLYDSVTVTTAGIPADVGTQYIPAPTTSPQYDWDGNLTSDGRWAYTWDCENRLVSMECAPQLANTPAGAIAVPGYRLTFTYDGLSRRIAKMTEYRNISTAAWSTLDHLGFAYDGWNMVMSCRMGGYGGRVASYVWGPDIGSSGYARSDWQKAGGVGGLLMVLDGVSTAHFTTYLDGTPTDVADDDYFPLFDRLGNIIGYRKAAVSTATVDYNNLGATGALYDYDAFGRELRSSGPAADLVPFHFSTKFTDQETGLNYYGYRYYDPQNGRWLNRDPIAESGGKNLVAIVSNNLIESFDVLGNRPIGSNIYWDYINIPSSLMNWFPHCDCRCKAIQQEVLRLLSLKKSLEELKELAEKRIDNNSTDYVTIDYAALASAGGGSAAPVKADEVDCIPKYVEMSRQEWESLLNPSMWGTGADELVMRLGHGIFSDSKDVAPEQALAYANVHLERTEGFLKFLLKDFYHHCKTK